jgi:basic membrane lipoprotein Med (substrate-binding protein (PBP1-ABC) superfamily)
MILFVCVVMTLLSVPVLAEDEVFQVAMVMPSKINDYSFSQSMYEALKVLQSEVGEEKL